MIKKIILGLVVGVVVATTAGATGINVYIDDGAIRNKDGGALPNADYHPYASKLEFFHGALPAPNSSTGKLLVNTATQYTYDSTRTPPRNKYQLSTLDGGTLYIRVWSGAAVAPTTTSNTYYGKTSGSIAGGPAPSLDTFITNLRTNYKCAPPNAPAIGAITEALTRTGDTYNLNLSIPINYDEATSGGSASDGRREIQDVYMTVTYPDAHTENKSGSPVGLNNTPGGTYKFKPYARNWYGTTEGPEVTYTTGSMGGGAGPVTYPLNRRPDGIGLNPIAILHTTPFNVTNSSTTPDQTTPVDTIGELVAAINGKSGSNNTVTTIGWMENSEFKGFYVTYTETGTPTFTPTTGLTGGGDTTLIRGQSYQVGVLRDVTGGVTFSQ